MKILNAVLIVGLVILFACNSGSEKETPNGMKFNVLKKGNGVLPKPGDVVVFQFVLNDSKDSVWGKTSEFMPAAAMINDSSVIVSEDGITQMLRMVSKGDSVRVSFPIKKFFNEIVMAPIPYGVDSTLTLTYNIRVDTILNQMDFMVYQRDIMEKFSEKQLEKDVKIIDEYLAKNNIDAVKLESGLRYVITKPGTGENAISGQTVKVHYTGYLLDGQHFDTSVQSVAEEHGLYNPMRPYDAYEVTIDQSSVIKGWHEALKYLNAGAQGTFYIPSILAYGPQQRSEVIKENSILVFDMEVLEVK
ncbi:MAG: FKBP-type peptidyl-prolyl cis-trans isomerase [Cyclobacteriaceae bacterium]|nr:FKBP-type peptidyl-prolyl cis-trans isomerase [Cyclobacteriaceae bacterium]